MDWLLFHFNTDFCHCESVFILFYLFAVDGVNPQDNCSYQDVLNYLNLSRNNELYTMTRPVTNYKHPTYVSLEVLLYAILDVVSGFSSTHQRIIVSVQAIEPIVQLKLNFKWNKSAFYFQQ